jgi:valyl-tRNA synthetase
MIVRLGDKPKPPVCYPEDELTAYLCLTPGIQETENLLEQRGWVRDPDVLDTWFSSALWPFSTLGWPDATPELATFYPGDVLCTAREIITLWVSRMVMMGQYCRGDIPFHDVFIHAMIQDGEGRKMSKSLGNGIDPLEIIDSHGADAMRFTLVSMTTQTQDVRLPVAKMKLPDGRDLNSSPKFDVGRNFCNKLWNASRFAMMNLRPCPSWGEVRPSTSLADRWILSRLNATIRDATAALEGYRFNELGDTLYHFMWDDFCDWYLEIAKGRINAGEGQPRAIVAHALDVILRLLHPIAPFITEAIWANLNQVAPARGPAAEMAEPMLIRAAWPRADAAAIDAKAEADFAAIQDLIRQVRNVRTQHNVPPSKRLQVQAHVEAGQERLATLIRENADLFTSQANLETLTVFQEKKKQEREKEEAHGQDARGTHGQDAHATEETPPADAAAIAVSGVKLYVLGAVDKAAELTRLTKQRDTLAKGIGAIEAKLGSAGFVAKAPPAVVEKERKRLEGLQAELAAVEKSLAGLRH